MLFTVPDLQQIDKIWHPKEFWAVRNNMSDAEYQAVWERWW